MKEMVQKERVSKECEGPSFGVGSIGKVRVLMMQELDSASSKTRPSATVPVSVYCCEFRKRSQMMKTKCNQKGNNSCNKGNGANNRRAGRVRKKVHQTPSPQCIPMLVSEDISMERIPNRGRSEKRRARIVDIVDLKCGNSETGPITNQLRRLSFSKLSD